MKREKRERIYVCHTYYHVYITVLKECNLPKEERGKATLVLSTLSNDFERLQERARRCGLFEEVVVFAEKDEHHFPQLKKYHTNRGNILLNMFARICYTKLLGKLQEPYVPVDFRNYRQIYVFCDSDPIGYYLSYRKIYYHAIEDGLDCIKSYDTARYDNRGHFALKAKLAAWNLIFIQNGYGKYCIDMEVNNIACLPYPCPKYREKPRKVLAEGLQEEDRALLVSLFLENVQELMEQLAKLPKGEKKLLLLSEPLCDLETRKRIFEDIIAQYAPGMTVFIKPHPRDDLDYEQCFPGHIVLKGRFPMEVMNFLPGIQWDKVISVFTVCDAITNTKEVVFLGEDFMDGYEDPALHRQNEAI